MSVSYLSHVDVLGDDLRTGLRRQLAQYHKLDPLRNSIEECDGPLQSWIVNQATVDHVAAVIGELGNEDVGTSVC